MAKRNFADRFQDNASKFFENIADTVETGLSSKPKEKTVKNETNVSDKNDEISKNSGNDDNKEKEDTIDGLNEDSDDFMDDVLDDMLHDKKDGDILSYILGELSNDNIITKIFTRKYWKTAQIFARLAHRTQLAYPLASDLSIVNCVMNNNILKKHEKLDNRHYYIDTSSAMSMQDEILYENMKYAMRHAMAAYPSSFLLMGSTILPDRYDKQKVSFGSVAFQSQKSMLEKYFGKDNTNVIVNKLSDFKFNKTHKPCYYVMTDDNAPININGNNDKNDKNGQNETINRKKLVIAIRGSQSVSDFITDMDATDEIIRFVTSRSKSSMTSKTPNSDPDAYFEDILNELAQISTTPKSADLSKNKNGNEIKDANDKDEIESGFIDKSGIKVLQGHCHSGIYRSARWLKGDLDSLFFDTDSGALSPNSGKPKKELKKKWLEYDIIITGHSLGAGVANMLGLLLFNDSIIYNTFIKTGRLKCFGFASPCIVDSMIGIEYPIGSGLECARMGYENDALRVAIDGMNDEYIYTIALGTDLVTRMSVEAILQCNIRLDYLRKCTKKLIRKSIVNLQDALSINDSKENEEWKEEATSSNSNDKNKSNDDSNKENSKDNKNKKDDNKEEKKEESKFSIADYSAKVTKQIQDDSGNDDVTSFLNNLVCIKARKEKRLMYPAGKVLWYVPEIVFEKDIVERRRKLMNVSQKDELKYLKRLTKEEKSDYSLKNTNNDDSNSNDNENNDGNNGNSNDKKWDSFVASFKKKEKVKKTTVNDMDWILTDATLMKHQFQHYIFEFWESLMAHFPMRYMFAIDPDLTLDDNTNKEQSKKMTNDK